jgi:hypothetical protein
MYKFWLPDFVSSNSSWGSLYPWTSCLFDRGSTLFKKSWQLQQALDYCINMYRSTSKEKTTGYIIVALIVH